MRKKNIWVVALLVATGTLVSNDQMSARIQALYAANAATKAGLQEAFEIKEEQLERDFVEAKRALELTFLQDKRRLRKEFEHEVAVVDKALQAERENMKAPVL